MSTYAAVYTQPGLSIAPADILALVFEKETYPSGTTGSGQTGPAGTLSHLLALGTLLMLPTPTDWRTMRQPDLWTAAEPITDTPIPQIYEHLNRSVFRHNTDIQQQEIAGKTVRELIQLTRQKGFRYLYLVRYNVYQHYSETTGRFETHYSGYIPAASRVIIDTTTGETVFIRAREGEAYFMLFPWVNGYWTDPALWKFDGQPLNVRSYVMQVGSLHYGGALNRLSRYVLIPELAPILNGRRTLPEQRPMDL